MYLLVRSLSTPIIDSRLRPVRTFVVAMVGVAAVFGALGLAVGDLLVGPPPAVLDVVLHSMLGVGWAWVAWLMVRRAADRLQGDVLWIGLALGCLAAANAMRAGAGTDSPAGMLAATAVSVLAAAVALHGTTLHLTAVLVDRGAERMRMYVDLLARDAHQRTQEASSEERLHDARSTLAAIRVAAGTLQRYEHKLEAAQRESLQTAVTSELVRLEHLIDPPSPDQLQTFRVESVLSPVVETERALGSDVELLLRDATAFARPNDVVRIVQNLLTNARRHAPGTCVRLSAVVREGYVTISVADEGPGVPPDLRETVFERGYRSTERGGDGLGLYVARQLATELGGSLRVHARVGGGAVFSLRLPSGPPEQAPDEVADGADVGQDQRRRRSVRRQQHGRLGGNIGEAQYVAALTRRIVTPGEHLDGLGFG
jgi:signal transduction histidine kinase